MKLTAREAHRVSSMFARLACCSTPRSPVIARARRL